MNLALLSALWLSWLALGAVSERRAKRDLGAVGQRILVFGGRGKTSLVRLIHTGLRASGSRVVGRVTGDRPVVLRPDGSDQDQRRLGPANIREIRRLLSSREVAGVDAVVVENMAIDPELQAVVARRMVRPTLAVMAPDALDHLEVYPVDDAARVRLLLMALPVRTRVLLPGSKLELRCATNAGLIGLTAPELADSSLRPYMRTLAAMALEAVSEVTHTVSVAARTAVLDAARTLQGITVYRRGRVAWVDGLSVNDPHAALQLADEVAEQARRRSYVLEARLFNHRRDRPSRLPLFAPLLDHGGPAWVVGEPFPPRWRSQLPSARLRGSVRSVVQTVESALATKADPAYVLCLGNSGGLGRGLRRWLAGHAQVESW